MAPDQVKLQTYIKHFRERQARQAHEQDHLRSKAQATAELLSHRLRTRWGATEIILFGSLAKCLRGRGSFLARSDIDLAVRGLDSASFFRILADLESISYCPVDLVYVEECSPQLRQSIERDGILL